MKCHLILSEKNNIFSFRMSAVTNLLSTLRVSAEGYFTQFFPENRVTVNLN